MSCTYCETSPVKARSLCNRCYARTWWRKTANPDTFAGWPKRRYAQWGRCCELCGNRTIYARGLCKSHYGRLKRRGLLV